MYVNYKNTHIFYVCTSTYIKIFTKYMNIVPQTQSNKLQIIVQHPMLYLMFYLTLIIGLRLFLSNPMLMFLID